MSQPTKTRRRRWPWFLAGLAAVLVVVIGVATDGATSPTGPGSFVVPTTAAAAPTSAVLTAEEEELFGPRVELPGGLLLKQLGKVAQWGGPDDQDNSTWGVRMVVDKIEVDPECSRYVDTPDRGHRLVVSLRVETSERYDSFRDGIPQYFEWSTIGPDGVSEASPNSSRTCRNDVAFPHELRPSAKYRGEVTIETANPVGRLVFNNFAVYDYPVMP